MNRPIAIISSAATGIFLALSAVAPRSTCASDAPTLLTKALHEYQAALESANRDERLRRFRQAEMLFEQLVRTAERELHGSIHPQLLVNWGNAALGAEQLETAIFAYRRALLADPNQPQALQNLRQARNLLPDWVPRPDESGFFGPLNVWMTKLSREEQRTWTATLFLIAAALLASSMRWQKPSLRFLAITLSVVWAATTTSLLWPDRQQPEGVIAASEVVVRVADATHAPAKLPQPLPAGTEVTTLEKSDSWRRIRLADGRDGWVPAAAVRDVGP